MSLVNLKTSQGIPPIATLASLGIFFFCTHLLHQSSPSKQFNSFEEVVIPAPIQTIMYGGDRYLGANIESARAAGANNAFNSRQGSYRIRARQVVTQLNPCHEDNYWIGNASLSWGGAVDEGLELLNRATQCRYWDEWPPFFYGFNQYFFKKNIDAAREAIELAAQRSETNNSMFRKFSIMLLAGEIDDARGALAIIKNEREKTNDPVLRDMLEKRIIRFTGLIKLRDAQASYETNFNRPPKDFQELIQSGILDSIPEDPLGLGYEYKNQKFILRELHIQ